MIKLCVSTPNGEICNETCDFVVARTDVGEMGFLKDHAPVIARITNGFIRYNSNNYNNCNNYIAIQGGIIDVNNNNINVVCQYAMSANSYEEAKRKIDDYLDARLKESKRKMVDFVQAENELVKNIKNIGASDIK